MMTKMEMVSIYTSIYVYTVKHIVLIAGISNKNDLCELLPNDGDLKDSDRDGVGDLCDNCKSPNPLQVCKCY